MARAGSYNRQRAIRARELARCASVMEHRQHYMRLAFQYDAIADLESQRPKLRLCRSKAKGASLEVDVGAVAASGQMMFSLPYGEAADQAAGGLDRL